MSNPILDWNLRLQDRTRLLERHADDRIALQRTIDGQKAVIGELLAALKSFEWEAHPIPGDCECRGCIAAKAIARAEGREG